MQQYNQYLQRCFELALLGETYAHPNPVVGCIIVHGDKIIADGFHKKFGEAHAELNAVNNAIESGHQDLLEESDIYVSLEPCSHHGKTPPCSELIIKHKFRKLIFACSDPNPQVSGQGIQAIKEAGIEVIGPDQLDLDLVQEAKFINRHFFHQLKSPSRPYITVKVAKTTDGRMVTKTDEDRWITNEDSRKYVHRLRSTHDLLITGINTVKQDDPLFTVRHAAQDLGLEDIKNPDILILKSSSDFNDVERSQLKVFQDNHNRQILEARIADSGDYPNLDKLIEALSAKGYKKIMVEAGPKLSQAFIESGLTNEIIHFQAQGNSFEGDQYQRYLNDSYSNKFQLETNYNHNEDLRTHLLAN